MPMLQKSAVLAYFQKSPRLTSWLKNLLIVNIIAFGCAAALSVLFPRDGFIDNLVFSLCIANCAFALIDIVSYLLFRNKRTHLGFYGVTILIAPFAFYLGSVLAAMLRGYDYQQLRLLQSGQNKFPIAFTLLVSLLATWIFWNRGRIQELAAIAANEKAKAAAIEKQAMQAQLQLLQAQIEPHMLFNTLANVQALIAIDTDKAQHMLDQFIQYLRASLSASRAEKTSLKQEFVLIQAYLEIMAIRMGKRLQFELDLPPELADLNIAPMLLQPLIENAIKHGIEPSMEGGTVRVSASYENNILHLVVKDNGLGIHQTATSHHPPSQLGNKILRERILALYGDKASMTLQANPDAGATAHLYLPITRLSP